MSNEPPGQSPSCSSRCTWWPSHPRGVSLSSPRGEGGRSKVPAALVEDDEEGHEAASEDSESDDDLTPDAEGVSHGEQDAEKPHRVALLYQVSASLLLQ